MRRQIICTWECETVASKSEWSFTSPGIVCHSDVSSVLMTMWRRQPQAPPQRRFASLSHSIDKQQSCCSCRRQRLSSVGQTRRDDGDETFTHTLNSDRWKWAHNYKEMDWRRPEMVANRTSEQSDERHKINKKNSDCTTCVEDGWRSEQNRTEKVLKSTRWCVSCVSLFP